LTSCEQHDIDVVIIASETEQGIEKELRGTVMRLRINGDAVQVDWELSQLSPKRNVAVQ